MDGRGKRSKQLNIARGKKGTTAKKKVEEKVHLRVKVGRVAQVPRAADGCTVDSTTNGCVHPFRQVPTPSSPTPFFFLSFFSTIGSLCTRCSIGWAPLNKNGFCEERKKRVKEKEESGDDESVCCSIKHEKHRTDARG